MALWRSKPYQSNFSSNIKHLWSKVMFAGFPSSLKLIRAGPRGPKCLGTNWGSDHQKTSTRQPIPVFSSFYAQMTKLWSSKQLQFLLNHPSTKLAGSGSSQSVWFEVSDAEYLFLLQIPLRDLTRVGHQVHSRNFKWDPFGVKSRHDNFNQSWPE